jgi:hypothetical protein
MVDNWIVWCQYNMSLFDIVISGLGVGKDLG